MKATYKPARRSAAAGIGLLCLVNSGEASAQDLVVVLSSEQDAASADKLAELIREPFERVGAASLAALPPTAAGGCRTGARIELHLDSAARRVQLIRCRDATVLARGLDPEAASQTPYLGAFVAAELLAIDRELDAAETRALQSEQPTASLPSPAPAAVSGSVPTPVAPPAPFAEVASPIELQLRAGAELTLWGAPFDHTVRPNLGLGVVLTPDDAVLAWFAELSFGLFALAEQQRGRESLELQRHDGGLHSGVRVELGPVQLAGFALLRASLTSSEYTTADVAVTDTFVRFGVGLGAQADVPLTRTFSVYLQAKFDVATSRSEYRVANQSRLTDPASLLWVGLGLLLRVRP
jgi:hypothetical protein